MNELQIPTSAPRASGSSIEPASSVPPTRSSTATTRAAASSATPEPTRPRRRSGAKPTPSASSATPARSSSRWSPSKRLCSRQRSTTISVAASASSAATNAWSPSGILAASSGLPRSNALRISTPTSGTERTTRCVPSAKAVRCADRAAVRTRARNASEEARPPAVIRMSGRTAVRSGLCCNTAAVIRSAARAATRGSPRLAAARSPNATGSNALRSAVARSAESAKQAPADTRAASERNRRMRVRNRLGTCESLRNEVPPAVPPGVPRCQAPLMRRRRPEARGPPERGNYTGGPSRGAPDRLRAARRVYALGTRPNGRSLARFRAADVVYASC
jgi:hypothetical protein